jgi:hypothetical protein
MLDDDDRLESARMMAENGSPARAAAYRSIAADGSVGDDMRLEAATGSPRSASALGAH